MTEEQQDLQSQDTASLKEQTEDEKLTAKVEEILAKQRKEGRRIPQRSIADAHLTAE